MPANPVNVIQQFAHPLSDSPADFDLLLEQAANCRFVLLGEASHGTHDFYSTRAEITKRLIAEKGFNVVALEADWPDAYRVHRYVTGKSGDSTGLESLGGFKRFPTWMWRNFDVLEFVEWLRGYNESKRDLKQKAGFYGLDLYSLYTSIEAVLEYLQKIDPEAAKRARKRYGCFEHFGEDSQAYGYAASSGMTESCEQDVVQQLIELRRRADEYARRDGIMAEDEYFFAEQNARLIKNAEEYYRSMFRGRVSSWNLRDGHMVETLEFLMAHLDKQGRKPKAVIWAHNSHLGNAAATQMGERGEFNVGQLMRERHKNNALLIGFTSYTGTVTAASDWGDPTELKQVNPGMKGSYELLFHQAGIPDFYLSLQEPTVRETLREPPRLERAIGVIYRPDTEFYSHYFHARLPDQFDGVFHFDTSSAVEPLDRSRYWVKGEAPETFPSGV
jgi:erythromycin esterase-like protein